MKKVNKFMKIDKILLLIMITLSITGIVFVLSASSVSAVLSNETSPYYFAIRQSIYVITAYAIGYFIILNIPTKTYTFLSKIGIIGVISVLICLLAVGSSVNGAKSWIDLGFFSVQPSEFAKLILIIFMGVYYDQYQRKKDKEEWEILIPVIVGVVIFFLTALQPDLGTAIIIAGIVGFIFFSLPIKNKFIFWTKRIFIFAIVPLIAIYLFTDLENEFLTEMQQERLTYAEPCSRYTESTGYQVCNGFIAINAGGLTGVGLGNSTQKYLYLPEAHTDFIFPIVVEEMGVLFGIFIIFLYLVVIYRVVLIAKSSYKLRNSIICYGIAIYILLHIIINFCGILALIPLTGVPVPFLSFGGSFTLNLLISLFIVQRIHLENFNTKRKIEISNI